ncbi:hypothetical protein [Pseudomonas sp. DWRC2-2]|uniref:hypothetical protein n=1 Tax=Pseudomonas sp. DWRC2-2 TaxID=2804567 RepID=UPI003CE7C8B8
MAYSINISASEISSAVFLEFKHLSDEFRIVKICRFQCIGWILDAISKVEEEVKNGAIWVNPEVSVQALVEFAKIPEVLAKEIIASDSRDEIFNLAWNNLSDEEKNTAITVNFTYHRNFWLGFETYAKAITLHLANTKKTKDLEEKVQQLESDLRRGSKIISLVENDKNEHSM